MPPTLTLVHAVNACEELWQDLLQQLQIGGQLLQRAHHRVVLHDVLFSALQTRSIRWSTVVNRDVTRCTLQNSYNITHSHAPKRAQDNYKYIA